MFTLNCRGKLLIGSKPLLMGIINVTPDSFYEGSRFSDEAAILRQVEKMISEGADIIDIGGQSTRPGSDEINEEEELNRVIEMITTIVSHFPETVISIDTYRSGIATEAVAAGASMVNDVSGGQSDVKMLQAVAGLKVPYICMHSKGKPKTMQQDPFYENVAKEVLDFFIGKLAECKEAGIHDVIVDPGFGFGKTIRHNFELLKNLDVFNILDKPLLVGISRKSTIYRTLRVTPEEALNGTTVLHTLALLNGAGILRVHDVKEAKETISLFEAYNR